MSDTSELARDLAALDAELRRLEAEYNMYFAGRLPRPPVESRARVTQMVKRLDRQHIPNTGDRFRFTTLQARFAAFADLWDRGLRAREEGRPGPFRPPKREAPSPAKPDRDGRILHVAAFRDPRHETDKLQELYDRLVEARRSVGEEAVPFQRFAELIRTQVQQLRQQGSPEVAFRVAVKDGKVRFTAKGVKGT